jgi:flagellar protein FliO/FliZ
MIDGSVAGMLVRLVLSLATVLMLMAFLARYLRNRQQGIGLRAGATQRRKKTLPLQVVSRQGLSRGSSLAVVRVSGQLLLLGVTEATVSVLRELEDVDPDEPDPAARVVPVAAQVPPGSPADRQDPSGSYPAAEVPPGSPADRQDPSSSYATARDPSGGRARAGSAVERLRQWTVRRG